MDIWVSKSFFPLTKHSWTISVLLKYALNDLLTLALGLQILEALKIPGFPSIAVKIFFAISQSWAILYWNSVDWLSSTLWSVMFVLDYLSSITDSLLWSFCKTGRQYLPFKFTNSIYADPERVLRVWRVANYLPLQI